MSYSTLRKYFRDVLSVTISRGLLSELVRKVSASLADPYEALCAMLPTEDRLNVDETGHEEIGQRLWTWCFLAYLYTVYEISPSRGSEVLVEVLGTEFNGILGCDYFSAYHKYMRDFGVLLQFCLAHLIRDVEFLVEWSTRTRGIKRTATCCWRICAGCLVSSIAVTRMPPRSISITPWKRPATNWCGTPHGEHLSAEKPTISRSVSARTRTATFALSPSPTSSPPTTWRNKPFALSPSIVASRKVRAVKTVVAGANGSGQ